MNEENRLSVKQSVLQKMIDYLQDRPYKDVADLIAELVRDAKPIVPDQPEEGPANVEE